MMKNSMLRVVLASSVTVAASLGGWSAANAATIVVTPTVALGWSNPSGENSGGGSSAITGSVARNGNGSLELHGDRTRFSLGGLYGLYVNPSLPGATNYLGTLSDFTDLSFSYMVKPGSSTRLDAKYSPALRIVFYSPAGVKDELVFEQAYQTGGYGSVAGPGNWVTTSSSSLFYDLAASKQGDGHLINDDRTISQWISDSGIGSYKVGGIYIGVGSSAGANYTAFVDNVRAHGTTYNFEVLAPLAAVPEPASWAMMVGGFGIIGGAIRRRRPTDVRFG